MVVTSVVSLSSVLANQRMEAEFYKSDVLRYLRKKLNWVKIGSILDFAQYGTSLPLNEEGAGYKIFRLNEIESCFLTKPKKWIVLPPRQYHYLHLEKDDILFCRTNGNIKYVGRTGILKDDIDAVFASYLVRAKPDTNQVLPEYFTVYLNTKVGRAFIERQAMQSNQFNVSAEQLRKIPMPLFGMDFQNQIKKFVDKAAFFRNLSYSFYFKAENMLLDELMLKNFNPKRELFYSANLSDAFGVYRVDAEYFQPVYDKLIKNLSMKFEVKKLGKLVYRKKMKINTKPEEIYRYIEISDISTDIGEINYTKRLGGELPPNARIPIDGGELVISKVRPTRGAIGIIPEKLNKNVICSSAFSVFTAPSPLKEYLYLITRSIVGKIQIERPTTGTSYPTIDDRDVENITVPILPNRTQQKIASLVQQSHEARRKVKDLLEKAKSKVENAVEKEQKS